MADDNDAGRHWAMDTPDGLTVEDLADSLTREAEAVAQLAAGPVFVRRGDDGPWREITAEDRRRAGL